MEKVKILDVEDYYVIAKDSREPKPRQDIKVVSSSGNHEIYGYKCAHSVYIPYNSLDHDRAEFCSLCHPYILQEKTDAGKTGLHPKVSPQSQLSGAVISVAAAD